MTVLNALSRLALAASRRSDVIVATFLLLAVVMMIIPLPTTLVDVLIGANISISVLILVVAFYISHPVQFSSLPPVILLGTLFRLALTITTTRLILLDADAGRIVQTFGEFVISGSLVVGLVVFLIITIAQFVVITKGGERVAEVAARFTLDAMPGKQMSIDNDLRNGDIKQEEARARRHQLERESQLYGAMDGAMKFVKGDAIASLIVVIVNLVGGLLIGMLQKGMSFADAAQLYCLLTIGDGLVAQIPSLLISVAAGTVVTRVSSDQGFDLGTEISSQLFADPRALALASAILLGLAFIPGFPVAVFVALSVMLATGAYLLNRQRIAEAGPADERPHSPPDGAQDFALSETSGKASRYRVTTWVGQDLAGAVPFAQFRLLADRARQDLYSDLGVDPPAVELRVDPAAEPQAFRIDLEGVPVADGDIPTGHLLLRDDPVHLDLMSIPYVTGRPLLRRGQTIWVDERHKPELQRAGIGFADPAQALTECLSQTLSRYAAHFIGIQETRELLGGMESQYGELVKEALRVTPIQRISDILRRLVEEDVPIRNLRSILEAIAEWGAREQDPVMLTEYVRSALARQICYRNAVMDRVISAYVLARNVEDAVRSAVRPTAVGAYLSMPDDVARVIVGQIRGELAKAGSDVTPAVLASMDIRRHVRNLLARNDVLLPVMSYQELAPEFTVQSLASITLALKEASEAPAATRAVVSSAHTEPVPQAAVG
jgi:type III secretion protein V